ncbi:MAG TPA: hypothetical protein GXZ90_10190 [Clostridiales bacterium]|nr:hypothetical protein [Clostridiales bacterium]
MDNVIRQINKIMGVENMGSQLSISFYNDGGIVFGIYEHEIPIVVDKDNKQVHLDCETVNVKLTYDMLSELTQITKLIQDNIDTVLKCISKC